MASNFKGAKFFCNEDCNNCDAIQNPQLSLLMNVLTEVFGDAVIGITNVVCPNMTCCADCHIDDMCHWGDSKGHSTCRIEKEAKRIAKWYIRENVKGKEYKDKENSKRTI